METGRMITVNVKMGLTRRTVFLLLSLLLLAWSPNFLGSETLELTGYYPAPYGAYVALLTTNQTLLARDNGNVGIGTTNPQTPAPNKKTGNLDVNDIYLRGAERWASQPVLSCRTVREEGQDAHCPEGYIVTGCAAGMNKGSIDANDTYCHTQESVDWTNARCCKII